MTEILAAPLQVAYPDAIVQNVHGGVRITGLIVLPGQPQAAIGPDGRPVMAKGLNGTPVPIMLPAEPQKRPLCTWFEPGVYWVKARLDGQDADAVRLWLVPLGTTPEQAGLVPVPDVPPPAAPPSPLVMG